jgi:hypothetical protein
LWNTSIFKITSKSHLNNKVQVSSSHHGPSFSVSITNLTELFLKRQGY